MKKQQIKKINEIYQLGLSNGARGEKLLGTGGGEFTPFYATKEQHAGNPPAG